MAAIMSSVVLTQGVCVSAAQFDDGASVFSDGTGSVSALASTLAKQTEEQTQEFVAKEEEAAQIREERRVEKAEKASEKAEQEKTAALESIQQTVEDTKKKIAEEAEAKLIVKINSMKGKNLSIMAMIAAVFCSCGQQPAQERGPRPVKLAEVTSLSRIEKSYSGVVSPDQFSDLAFKMSGPLVAMNVLEGQRVKKGQVVAEIDPTDYKLDYDAKRASFQKASSQMQRAEKLLAKNAISMQEFETTQASYTNAKSAFENAQNTLNDTKLRAPFDGFIQKKYVENYQRVQPGQGVVCLINPAKLQVEFTIPETNISYVTSPSTIYVEFDAYKGKLFQAKVKEYVEASPDGAGVPVFLYIDDPEFDLKKYKVSVGFSCRVIVNIENDVVKEGITVPLSAVVFDNNLNSKIVFIYNPSTQKVELRKVSDEGIIVGRNDLIVSGNIEPGEQVVSAGASYLVDGQQVKILTE